MEEWVSLADMSRPNGDVANLPTWPAGEMDMFKKIMSSK